MSSFTAQPDLTLIPGTREFYSNVDLGFWTDRFGERIHLTVPAGERTDLVSSPKFAWTLVDPMDPHVVHAAIFHDYGYRTKTHNRKFWDLILLEGMQVLGAPVWKQQLVYRSVRIGGWYHWYDVGTRFQA